MLLHKRNIDWRSFDLTKNKVSATVTLKLSTESPKPSSTCSFDSLSPEEGWQGMWWIITMVPTLQYSLYSGKEMHKLR
ncbi:hypothetical protein ATANTOWER_027240 [Ataeniobius toweri]|uniref:Uncharacterized protein n=1 Tax=Ataeniobius toweri TaxID=208326 RepID=A0ABU7C0R6_9TELE|nr:hypothetical protein [Ataeniobius toweri]